MSEEELKDLASRYPIVDHMVRKGLPIDRDTYVALNTPEYDPDDLPPEVEAELPDVFKKERQETDEAESEIDLSENSLFEMDKVLREQGRDAAIRWVEKWLNSK